MDPPDPVPPADARHANAAGAVATADELATIFAASWTAPLPSDLGVRLVALCQQAHRAHPSLAIDDRELVAAIAARAARSADESYLERCHAADLALAIMSSRGSEPAITKLERAYRMTIDSTCRRFAGAAHTAEDLKQLLRSKLFVAEPGKPPKLADYAGQGHLESWLRVTAVRIFLDLGKRKDRARDARGGDEAHALPRPDEAHALPRPDEARALPRLEEARALPRPGDVVLARGKAEYRDVVTAAMHEAARQLEPGDRHLLRQHLVAGLSIDQLGAVLGIHRATAAGRISRAREQLVAHTRGELARRLHLDAHDLDEVIGLVMSRLDVSSIGALLEAGPRSR